MFYGDGGDGGAGKTTLTIDLGLPALYPAATASKLRVAGSIPVVRLEKPR